jgi:hypothetical protein
MGMLYDGNHHRLRKMQLPKDVKKVVTFGKTMRHW